MGHKISFLASNAVRVGFKTKFDNFLFRALRKQIAVGDLVNVKQFANKQELELRHDLRGPDNKLRLQSTLLRAAVWDKSTSHTTYKST